MEVKGDRSSRPAMAHISCVTGREGESHDDGRRYQFSHRVLTLRQRLSYCIRAAGPFRRFAPYLRRPGLVPLWDRAPHAAATRWTLRMSQRVAAAIEI